MFKWFVVTNQRKGNNASLSGRENRIVIFMDISGSVCKRSPFRNKITCSLLVTLLWKIKEYFFQDYNPIYEGNRSSQIVKTFKRNLGQHFRELVGGRVEIPLRVQNYADKQSLHVNYFSSVISSKTGKSVSAWIAGKTIAEA